MKGLYMVSLNRDSGKNIVTVGLGLALKENNVDFGYFKPLGISLVKHGQALVSSGALFIHDLFGLKDNISDVSPVAMTKDLIDRVMSGDATDYSKIVSESYRKIQKNHKAVIVGGSGAYRTGSLLGLSAIRVAELLDLNVLLVAKFNNESVVEEVVSFQEHFKNRLKGVVFNQVNKTEAEYITGKVKPFFRNRGLETVGSIPEDSVLNSISIAEIVDNLSGKLLCCEDKVDELVEVLAVGAMNVESAIRHFQKLPNKAVITGGDRSDIQLAALETSTKCLILTGDLYPAAIIVGKAQQNGIPIILVSSDTLTTVERLESMFGHQGLKQERKIKRTKELFMENVDYKYLINLV